MFQCSFQADERTAVMYRRCSTSEQKKSGLGLEAQESAIRDFCEREGFTVIGDFAEAASGTENNRPELANALKLAKETGSFVVVSKLCRLSRRVSKISSLMEEKVPFITAEFGTDVDPMVLHLFASFAEAEAARISRRTKEALAAKKAQGFKLGNPNAAKVGHLGGKVGAGKADEFAWQMKPLIDACRKVGIVSFTAISKHLNEIGKTTRRDGKWHPATVRQLLARIEKLTETRNAGVHGRDKG